MSTPRPLKQTVLADLDWSRPGTPAAPHFKDVYFSTDGGLEESRAVFLKGCGLPEKWQDRSVFTIAELGFGSGLNFLAAWQMWAATSKVHQRLHFVSIEKFPFDHDQLTRALASWPELQPFSQDLLMAWPGRVRGIHRIELGSVTLTLIHDDVAAALTQVDNLSADAWFLDGFSPAGNPAMWSEDIMKMIAKRSADKARLASFSVAGAVRTALSGAGFTVRKMPGFGRKRHRLEAEFNTLHSDKEHSIDRALIVGSGIAGRSLARALSARHLAFDIIDNHSHPAASSNPAALIKPRFDLQDRPESRFFLSAYLYALRSYGDDAILARGIRQLPKTEKDAARYKKLTEYAPLGSGHLSWQDNVFSIESGLVINPALAFNTFEIRKESYETAMASGKYSHVLLAAGYGIRDLAPGLHLRYSRGQLSWSEPVWPHPTAYGGYAINIEDAALIGATHDRLDDRAPFVLREEDDERNLASLKAMTEKNIVLIDRPSRASIRVTSRDTLPIIAKLGDNHWALTGLGSRGFTFAPLLAEAIVANLCGEVGPLDQHVRTLFSAPSRFH